MIRLGISGCGGHGVHHAIAALHAGGFRLVGGYDSNASAMQALAARNPGMRRVESFDRLLRSGIDAVVITSPDEHHYEQLMAALRGNPPVAAGLPMTPQHLHVMVDKPLACDPGQVATAIQAIERERQRGRVITSCHPRRFDPPYMWVADNLLRLVLRFGSLLEIHLNFEYGAPQAGWKKTARPLLLDHFSHEIDIVRYWLRDMPFEAVPVIYDRPDKYEATVTLTTRRGAKIPVICTGSREGETRFDETITLYFDRAKVTIHATPGEILIQPQHGLEEILPESVPSNLGGRLVGVMESFRKAIQGDPDYLTASDLRVNTLAAAMLATGKTYTYQP